MKITHIVTRTEMHRSKQPSPTHALFLRLTPCTTRLRATTYKYTPPPAPAPSIARRSIQSPLPQFNKLPGGDLTHCCTRAVFPPSPSTSLLSDSCITSHCHPLLSYKESIILINVEKLLLPCTHVDRLHLGPCTYQD